MKRRDFLKGAAVVAAGAAAAACGVKGHKGGHGGDTDSLAKADSILEAREARMPRAYQPATGSRMKLSWEPYELQLSHPFGVSGNTRTTTPDVQVKIEYDGFTGYGEASMPPYLGHTTESICAFLAKVKLGQFTDPFRIEEIMDYVDSLSKGDAPGKAAVDIFRDAVRKMVDERCDEETENAIRDLAMNQEGVERVDSLLTRKFGNRIYVEMEIAVDGEMSLTRAHGIAETVHDRIEAAFPQVKHIMIHVNPFSH